MKIRSKPNDYKVDFPIPEFVPARIKIRKYYEMFLNTYYSGPGRTEDARQLLLVIGLEHLYARNKLKIGSLLRRREETKELFTKCFLKWLNDGGL